MLYWIRSPLFHLRLSQRNETNSSATRPTTPSLSLLLPVFLSLQRRSRVLVDSQADTARLFLSLYIHILSLTFPLWISLSLSLSLMGANTSSLSLQSESSNESTTNPPSKPKLEDIPESCIALVLTHLDPLEICKLARLNQAFRGASSADFIWETKLPSNYSYLLEKLKDQREGSLGKKDLYSRLCRPSSFDGGSKEFWLDKSSGGVCLSISSKALTITGIDDRRYWNHIPTEESRFQTVAYLQQIWWFEVVGELEFQFPTGTYSLFFRLQLGKATKRLGRRICNVDQIHGWDIKPVQFQLTTSDGQHAVSRCFLDNPGNWVHYHAGDFVVDQPKELTKMKFSLTQIDCTHTKGGLCLDSVLICPSSLGKELRSLL